MASPDRLLREKTLVIQAGAITHVSDAPSDACYPGELWAAAPILAHAHLGWGDVPSQDWPRTSFAAWIKALQSWEERSADPVPYPLEALAAAGCSIVGDHRGLGSPTAPTQPDSCEPWAFLELIEPDEDLAGEAWAAYETAAAGLAGRTPHAPAPHAPYSCSTALARLAARHCRERDLPFSVHIGETAEEREFLLRGSGPLADLLAERGRNFDRSRSTSPVDWLDEVGGLRAGTLAVHCGDLTRDEIERVGASGATVVFCPGTHLYFDRPAPAFDGSQPWPLALGCDSLASNDRLDPFLEARRARRILPGLTNRGAWRALTCSPAAALGLGNGRLEPGQPWRVARFAIPSVDSADHAIEAILTGEAAFLGLGLPASVS